MHHIKANKREMRTFTCNIRMNRFSLLDENCIPKDCGRQSHGAWRPLFSPPTYPVEPVSLCVDDEARKPGCHVDGCECDDSDVEP